MEIQGRVPSGAIAQLRFLSANLMPPLTDTLSGEYTASQLGRPMGVAHVGGRITDVYMSVANCGRDDDAHLSVSGEVKINGTSCLSTKPKIGGNVGSAGEQKTTRVTGDTDITQAVIDADNNSVTAGDVITCDYEVRSEASPDEKLANPAIVVVFEPEKN